MSARRDKTQTPEQAKDSVQAEGIFKALIANYPKADLAPEARTREGGNPSYSDQLKLGDGSPPSRG